ncbi:MAG: MvaI/BcnI family restriction endonuclease [Pyrinomonadaceae bacterium]
MEIETLRAKLEKVKEKGYVLSLRRGNTGIGYTLETLLGVEENNIKLPDLGTIELKSKRKSAATPVTMFTFNSGAWKMPQKETIQKYGYRDKQNRQALKCFVTTSVNAQGLFVSIENDVLMLRHADGTVIAEWEGADLASYFKAKLPSLALVLADTKMVDGKEAFHYTEAYLLTNPTENSLLKSIEEGVILIDVRMHLNPNGSVRNRGTAFRIKEINLISCFADRIKLL